MSIDLDSESLTIAGGTGIDTAGSSNTLTVALDLTEVMANSGTANLLLTSDGDDGTLTGETGLTFDSRTLIVSGAVSGNKLGGDEAVDNMGKIILTGSIYLEQNTLPSLNISVSSASPGVFTTTDHGLAVGDFLSIVQGGSSAADVAMHGLYEVATVPATNQFTLKGLDGTPLNTTETNTVLVSNLAIYDRSTPLIGAGGLGKRVKSSFLNKVGDGSNLAVSGSLTVGSDGSGYDVTFNSATSGDALLWDASEEKLTITGTDGQDSFAVADGNATFADAVTVTGNTNLNGAVSTQATLTVGQDDTGFDVTFHGASAGAKLVYDESEDTLEIRGASANSANSSGKLLLSTAQTDVADGDIIGRIDFKAPLEAGGTDAITTAASIFAEADNTFAADNNETDLVFALGASAAATEKMRLTHEGSLILGGSLLPSTDDAHDLGSTTAAWQDLHLEGDVLLTDAGKVETAAGDLTLSSGAADVVLDAAADVIIDAAGGNVEFKDSGTSIVTLDMDTSIGSNAAIIKHEDGADGAAIQFKSQEGYITAMSMNFGFGGADQGGFAIKKPIRGISDAALDLSSVSDALPYGGGQIYFSTESSAYDITLPTTTDATEAKQLIGWSVRVISMDGGGSNQGAGVQVKVGDTSGDIIFGRIAAADSGGAAANVQIVGTPGRYVTFATGSVNGDYVDITAVFASDSTVTWHVTGMAST